MSMQFCTHPAVCTEIIPLLQYVNVMVFQGFHGEDRSIENIFLSVMKDIQLQDKIFISISNATKFLPPSYSILSLTTTKHRVCWAGCPVSWYPRCVWSCPWSTTPRPTRSCMREPSSLKRSWSHPWICRPDRWVIPTGRDNKKAL